MKELELVVEFKQLHQRRSADTLSIISNDRVAIDRQKKFIKEVTNSEGKLTAEGTLYTLTYSFNTVNFHPMIRLFKKYNLGIVKKFIRKNNHFYIKGETIQFDKDEVKLDKIHRVFVNPQEKKMTFLSVPYYVGYEIVFDTDKEFYIGVDYLNDMTPKFREFISPIVQKYKSQRREEIKKSSTISLGNIFNLVRKDIPKKIITCTRPHSEVEDICKKLYDDFVKLETLKPQSLEDLVKEHNTTVHNKIQKLQELKIVKI